MCLDHLLDETNFIRTDQPKSLMRRLFLFIFCAAGFALLWVRADVAAQEGGFKVIVNVANTETSITKSELSGFLLKKKSRWQGGQSVEPADLEGNSTVRAAMSTDVHGRSVASIKNYWQRQIFSGRNVPPPEVTSDAEMIAHVRKHAGGVGYVSASAAVADGVRELTLVD